MSTYDIERLSYAELVLRRPRMWTAGGTLPEVLSFFQGYDAAARMGARCQDESPCKLLDWLESECGLPRIGQLPAEWTAQIIGHYGSAELALEALSEHATQERKVLETKKTADDSLESQTTSE